MEFDNESTHEIMQNYIMLKALVDRIFAKVKTEKTIKKIKRIKK